ncbi:MAG: endonuclease MutS2 [Acidobacteria bacterium]|nr:endonuclease MutS2 [Acidobacteriota bacterium]
MEHLSGLLDEDGELRDDASVELRRIRRALRSARRAVRDRLERMTREPALQSALQEFVVTERNGRLVLPVRAGSKDRVPGVVHDTSSSGQTLFIEPLGAVEGQNRLAELHGEEREEIRRLLAEATAHIRAAGDGLRAALDVISRADSLQATSRWAEVHNAVAPLAADAVLHRGAKHPLLHPEIAVPLDLELGGDTNALVITGPNTGGKTVSLKTLGLAAAMAQCGLPVAATEARLPTFPRIHADIGDEQSLSASLSTFSGHLRHIAEFLGDCPDGTLILMDELGTGTDPGEGAALGIALVEAFVESGALVLASTHHDALKVFAERTAGVVNAAMEFDPETLAPTYRLKLGRPGRSNALEIASRLGLQPEVVERARQLVSDDVVELDVVLRGLEEQERALELAREQLQERQSEIEEAATLAARAAAEKQQSYAEAERAAREAVDVAIQEIRDQGAAKLDQLELNLGESSTRSKSDRRARLAATAGNLRRDALDTLDSAQQERAPEPAIVENPAPEPAESAESPASVAPDGPTRPLARGATVRVEPFGTVGTVMKDWAAGDEARVEVAVNGKRVVVPRSNVVPDAPPVPSRSKSHQVRRPRRDDVSAEIDLHGMRVDEALTTVDRHIDDALLGGLDSVRLIHGIGTFRLRDAIREHLRDRPEVASIAAADPFSGGEGVTVVRLED